ncbi:MAG: hypothetical protein ABIY90_09570 [Puia sp.]
MLRISGSQDVRMANWKAIRLDVLKNPDGRIRLFENKNFPIIKE